MINDRQVGQSVPSRDGQNRADQVGYLVACLNHKHFRSAQRARVLVDHTAMLRSLLQACKRATSGEFVVNDAGWLYERR
jgi:hypothetical protein